MNSKIRTFLQLMGLVGSFGMMLAENGSEQAPQPFQLYPFAKKTAIVGAYGAAFGTGAGYIIGGTMDRGHRNAWSLHDACSAAKVYSRFGSRLGAGIGVASVAYGAYKTHLGWSGRQLASHIAEVGQASVVPGVAGLGLGVVATQFATFHMHTPSLPRGPLAGALLGCSLGAVCKLWEKAKHSQEQ